MIWVLGMTNAINYIDGLDGLGRRHRGHRRRRPSSSTRSSWPTSGLLADGNIGPLLAVIVLGMCLGFLPWNIHPAKIFMGDAGALLLGLLMAASTMVVGGRTDQPFSGQAFFFFAPLFIPLLILGVPILDTAWSPSCAGPARARGVATADKDHLHHRLVRLGHGHWRSVLILWAWTALLSAFVLYPTYTGQGNGIVPFGIAALLLLSTPCSIPASPGSPSRRRGGRRAPRGRPEDAIDRPSEDADAAFTRPGTHRRQGSRRAGAARRGCSRLRPSPVSAMFHVRRDLRAGGPDLRPREPVS